MRSSRIGTQRNSRGVMIILLMFIIAFFLVGVLGVFSFEVSRVNTAREELRSAAEAAALSGAASLASSNSTNVTTTHNNAISAALATFQANSVEGQMLGSATQTSSNNSQPTAGQTTMYVEFLDPNNNYAVVTDLSSPTGKVVHVIAAQGYIPAFGKYAGVPNVDIRGDAQAAVPSLDIVMCFDCSSSIDDQTLITFTERYLKNGVVNYYIYDANHDGPNANLTSGPLYTVMHCTNPTGTSLNACPPQILSSFNQSASPATSLILDTQKNSKTGAPGSRSANPDYGTLPSNGGVVPSLGCFTDEVVNIDGNTVFANGSNSGSFTVSYNGKTYPFPNVATLIEAARGNLESTTVMKNSGADSAVNGVPASVIAAVKANGAGYQDAYMSAARANAQPIGKAQQAALTFFNIMNTNTDAHFSFVPFASTYHTSNGTADGGNVVDGSVGNTWYNDKAQTAPTWSINGTALSSTSPSTSYTTITSTTAGTTNNDPALTPVSLITSTIADGGTDIGDSVAAAGAMLQTSAYGGQSRTGAKRVIIFFTDGLPNGGNTDAWTAAGTINANKANIAIYTIGLAQNSYVIQQSVDCLNSTGSGSVINYTDPVTNQPATVTCGRDGISKIAGNGGQFFLVTNANNLNYVFENIARQLVSLVRN